MGIELKNTDKLEIVYSFIRIYKDSLYELVPHYNGKIEFRKLKTHDNQSKDIMVRLGNSIYISEEEVSRLGLTDAEILAAIAHEIGHIVYSTRGWDLDCENRADSLAAYLGLGNQMISAIEKLIESRRYKNLTSLLVNRIHFLQHLVS